MMLAALIDQQEERQMVRKTRQTRIEEGPLQAQISGVGNDDEEKRNSARVRVSERRFSTGPHWSSGTDNVEITRADGAVYFGKVQGSLAHGKGEQRWPTGEVYKGDWMDDMMHGCGSYSTPDGGHYEGHWVESKQHGEGTYKAPDGGKYKGQWVSGSMEGKGCYTWIDGAVYVGEFCKGGLAGYGRMDYADGTYYEGSWVRNAQKDPPRSLSLFSLFCCSRTAPGMEDL